MSKRLGLVKASAAAGVAPVVPWGPDFGDTSDNNTFTVGNAVALTDVALVGDLNVADQLAMTDLAADYNSIVVGDNLVMDALEAAYTGPSVGDGVTMDAVVVDYAVSPSVGDSVTMDSVAADYALSPTTGNHLSATLPGPPFWQSEAHDALTAPASSITVNVPAGTVDGDLMVAFVYTNDVGTARDINTPSGWTLVNNRAQGAGFARCFRRIASSEPASYAFTFAATVANATGEIHRLVATDPTTPIDVSAVDSKTALDLVVDPVCPSITTTVANCLVFAWAAHDHLALAQTHTPPASHVENTDYESSSGTPATKIGSEVSWRVFASAAATGTATVNCTETVATANIAFRVAVRPGAYVLGS